MVPDDEMTAPAQSGSEGRSGKGFFMSEWPVMLSVIQWSKVRSFRIAIIIPTMYSCVKAV